MAKFCEGCPAQGKANCELAGVFSDRTTLQLPFYGTRKIEAGVLVDNEGNLSSPMKMPTPINDEALVERIDKCERPEQTFWGKLLRRSDMVYCQATNNLRLDSKAASERMMELISLSLIQEGTPLRRIFKSSRFRSFNKTS